MHELATTTAHPPTTWEGLKVFDVSDPPPALLHGVRTDCGSHTHTVLPEADRLLVYVQSYDVSGQGYPAHATEGARQDLDRRGPEGHPALGRGHQHAGAVPGRRQRHVTGTRRATTGCHDITVYQEIGLAAGACTGEGAIIDISDPENPKVLASVEDPNFAFWHSATISQDGKKVLFTDELGGGSAPTCNDTIGPNRGADAIYDITDPANPKFMSYFKIPRTRPTRRTAWPTTATRSRSRAATSCESWYQGGISIIDWTDGTKARGSRGSIAARGRPRAAGPARRVLVLVLLQRVHLRQRDPARLRRLQGHGQRARGDRSPVRTLNAQTQF